MRKQTIAERCKFFEGTNTKTFERRRANSFAIYKSTDRFDTTLLYAPVEVSLLREPIKTNKRPPAFENYNTESETKSESIEVNDLKERHCKNGNLRKTHQINVTVRDDGGETNGKGVETKFENDSEKGDEKYLERRPGVANAVTADESVNRKMTHSNPFSPGILLGVTSTPPLDVLKEQNDALTEVAARHVKYDKQDQQGKTAFNERNPHTIQQQVHDWTSRGIPALVDKNITFIPYTERPFTAATRHKQHGCEHPHQKGRFDYRSGTPDSAVISPTTVYTRRDESEESVCSLEYLITQVYRPWIKHHINVMDILPLLPLDSSDKFEIQSKNKTCPPDAVDLVLDILADRNIPGKWQSFIDALIDQEYIHLSQLLLNKTEVHHTHSSNILNLVTNDLAKRMLFPEFMLKVFENGLITPAEREEADAAFKTKGSVAAAKVIIEYVDKHRPNWDLLFVDILKQSHMSDIAELFKMIERIPSPIQHKHGMRDDLNSERASRQSPFQRHRVQYWDGNASEQQQPFALNYDHNKPVEVIEVNNFNDLCEAVSEIQTDVKTPLQDDHQLKHVYKVAYV